MVITSVSAAERFWQEADRLLDLSKLTRAEADRQEAAAMRLNEMAAAISDGRLDDLVSVIVGS